MTRKMQNSAALQRAVTAAQQVVLCIELARTIYGVLGRGISKDAVIYGVYRREGISPRTADISDPSRCVRSI